jgi:hypothetical protein
VNDPAEAPVALSKLKPTVLPPAVETEYKFTGEADSGKLVRYTMALSLQWILKEADWVSKIACVMEFTDEALEAALCKETISTLLLSNNFPYVKLTAAAVEPKA